MENIFQAQVSADVSRFPGHGGGLQNQNKHVQEAPAEDTDPSFFDMHVIQQMLGAADQLSVREKIQSGRRIP